jgi:ATP-dependent DNA helicase RecG
MLSSVDKLQKFFRLEIERGYDNRAVVGGLDKILPSWEMEARANHLGDEFIQVVVSGLKSYPNLEPEQRAEILNVLMAHLNQAGSAVEIVRKPAPAPKVVDTLPPVEEAAEPEEHASGAADTVPDIDPLADDASATHPLHGEVVPRKDQSRAQKSKPGETFQRAAVRTYSSPDAPTGLDASVQVLQGVGSRLSQTLGSMGLNTLEDLLFYFPRRYDDYSQLKPINRLEFGEVTTVLGTVKSIHSRPVRGGKVQMTEAVVTDGTGSLRVTWFNQPWLANKYSAGDQVVLAGKIEQYLGRFSMANPEVEQVEQDHLHTNRIVPVYALTAGLNQKNLRRLMYQTVNYWAPRITDYLPAQVLNAVKLIDLPKALLNIHFPESSDMLDVARWRLAFDEIFLLQLGVLRQKRSWQAEHAQVFEVSDGWLEQQTAGLPFPLTGAQTRVLADIRADLVSGHPMDRLIQGDVGSGKTVVAALTTAMITSNGAQAAVMAPTGILAEQHYRTMVRLLAQPTEENEASLRPEEIRLLVGDTPEAEKQQIRAGLEDGSIKVIIGTHALIESPVQFQRLQLAIIDEQHRFGVAQRAALRSKGQNPHLLVMTATPIPRSLALTVYGDLDLSVIDEMPPGRQPISTHLLRPIERERAYTLIQSQVAAGRQAFIIYPRVEQNNDETDGESEQPKEKVEQLSAVEEHKRLQEKVFPKLKLGLLHGRLKPEEKDDVMKQFRDGEYHILVSTTVVEVGVDVPNASVMLIEGANRFGLAQLHQLRGRVGRGVDQSFCLLIPDKEDAVENERLAVMVETNDGFVLAERDLQQRGPGEFLGTRQAGYSELKMANLTDVRLIEKARQQAQNLFTQDPDFSHPEHQPLAKKLQQFWSDGRGDIS